MASKQELAIVYAALILEDEGASITAENVNKLLQAAGVQVEPFWPGLYVKALEGVNVSVSIFRLRCTFSICFIIIRMMLQFHNSAKALPMLFSNICLLRTNIV
jgi:large subunit ribosomal protein LP1